MKRHASRQLVLILGAASLLMLSAFAWHLATSQDAPQPQHYRNPELLRVVHALENAIEPKDASSPLPDTPESHPCQDEPGFKAMLESIQKQPKPITPKQKYEQRWQGIESQFASLSSGNNPYLRNQYHINQHKLLTAATPKDCANLLLLAANLNPANISAFIWREREPGKFKPDDPRHVIIPELLFSSPNPWKPLPGCLRLADGSYWRNACGLEQEQTRATAIAHADHLKASLQALANAGSVQQKQLGPITAPSGPDLMLGLLGTAQTQAQNLLDCYTGQENRCHELAIPARWQNFQENAAVRRVGLLQLDIASGNIEILASAHTPCFSQDNDGPGHDPHCPNYPIAPTYRPDRLANHALHDEAMPGSLVKIILSLALLRSDLGQYIRSLGKPAFLDDLKASRSAKFLDRLYAKDKNFVDQGRLKHLARAASDLGWNQSCADGDASCARQNPLAPLSDKLSVQGGRIMLEPGKAQSWQPLPTTFTPEFAQECANQSKDMAWRRCRGGEQVETLSELWGQGHAKASPLAVATLFARLGAAANGANKIIEPRLISNTNADGKSTDTAIQTKLNINSADAKLIISGLATHTKGGTAHSACLKVYGNAQACNQIATIAGKTGTPAFQHQKYTLDQRTSLCAAVKAKIDNQQASAEERSFWAACHMPPIKWYAALTRKDAQSPWGKVVVVLAERNYNRQGIIESPNDENNIAAEIALRFLKKD